MKRPILIFSLTGLLSIAAQPIFADPTLSFTLINNTKHTLWFSTQNANNLCMKVKSNITSGRTYLLPKQGVGLTYIAKKSVAGDCLATASNAYLAVWLDPDEQPGEKTNKTELRLREFESSWDLSTPKQGCLALAYPTNLSENPTHFNIPVTSNCKLPTPGPTPWGPPGSGRGGNMPPER